MTSLEVFKCVECGKPFNTLGRYNQHQKTHTKPFRCETCHQGFALRADLGRHITSRHRIGNLQFSCIIPGCPRMFARKDNISKHLKRDHPHEFGVQLQKKSPVAKPRSNDTTEPSDSVLSMRQTVFDWWQSARSGHISALESLLLTGIDVNCQAEDGNTALHCAAHAGQIAAIDYLIRNGARISIENKRLETALFEAAAGGSSECVLRLLEAGATVKFFKPRRQAPRLCFVDHVVRIGDILLVEKIIELNSFTSLDSTSKAYAFAVAAAKIGHIPILHSIIDGHPASLNERKQMLGTPIYYAVKNGKLEAVHMLLSLLFEGDNLKISAVDTRLLISLTARKGHLEVLQTLLVHFPYSIVFVQYCTSVLHEAAACGNLKFIQYILTIPDVAANIDFKDGRRRTALYVAAKEGHVSIVQELLKANADPGVTERYEYDHTPLMGAFWHGHPETLHILLTYYPFQLQTEEHRPEIALLRILAQHLLESGHLSIDSQGPYLREPYRRKSLLYLAIEIGDVSFAKLVLNHKDWNPEDINQNYAENYFKPRKTVFHLAQDKGHTEIADLLIAHGVKEHDRNKPFWEQGDVKSKHQPPLSVQEVEEQEADGTGVESNNESNDDSDLDADLETEPYSYVDGYTNTHDDSGTPEVDDSEKANKKQRRE